MPVTSLPLGPLDPYRKDASFDWNKLRSFIEGDEALKLKQRIWNVIESDPLYYQPALSQSSEEQHRLCLNQLNHLLSQKLFTADESLKGVKLHAVLTALGQYNVSLAHMFPRELAAFLLIIQEFGTAKHKHFQRDALSQKISCCVAYEEIAEGCKTTASYDPTRKEFVLHTNDFEAAKCWSQKLGGITTHAAVYARLITADGHDHGVHVFVVPIRDPVTRIPYHGIIAGDMGEKCGQNGTHTGFLMFNNFRIPHENLLDNLAEITTDGKYNNKTNNVVTFKDLQSRVTNFYTATSVSLSAALLAKSITIAVRYSAVRRQFGPTPQQEYPVIEYQLQQWRLFPYIAASYAFKNVADFFAQAIGSPHSKADVGMAEILHLLGATKSLVTSVTADGSQECREACGGHGYLKASGIGPIRSDNDGICFSNGCNSSLMLQCASWLLDTWQQSKQRGPSIFASAFGSADFLSACSNILTTKKFDAKSVEEAIQVDALLLTYKWLICWLLTTTEQRLNEIGSPLSQSQVFQAFPLGKAYTEHFVLQKFVERARSVKDSNLKSVLLNLCSLFGVWRLEKHIPLLYQGGYMKGPEPAKLLQKGLLDLCEQLKTNAVPLVDVLAPPDKVLNSVLGQADGYVYRAMQAKLFSSPETFERPSWWQDIVFWQRSNL